MVSELRSWRDKLLPTMTVGLAILAVLFFIGTFWHYAGLHQRMAPQEPELIAAMERLRAATASPASSAPPSHAYQDWYARMVLEEHAMRSRHRQNAAVVESRVWTRFMGFLTGMVMVMAGCVFILGRLETQFDGGLKGGGYEGALKTNSPGIVLAVAGTVLIGIALSVPVQIELTDKPVYIVDLTAVGAAPLAQDNADAMPAPALLQDAVAPASDVTPAVAAASGASKPFSVAPVSAAARMPPGLKDELCRQAGKAPGCMP